MKKYYNPWRELPKEIIQRRYNYEGKIIKGYDERKYIYWDDPFKIIIKKNNKKEKKSYY